MNVNRFLLFVSLLAMAPACLPQDNPTLSQSPMTADQIAVYRAFLTSYRHESTPGNLNLAKRTFPFDPLKEYEECLGGIQFDKAGISGSVIHQFDPQMIPPNITLVDREEQEKIIQNNESHAAYGGFLTLSEIAFDKRRQYAAFNYRWQCWGLCGGGGTVVFRKRNGEWVPSKRPCMTHWS